MKKVITLLILLAVVISGEGCAEKTQANSTNADAGMEKYTVIEVTSLEQINAALQKGPVFLKFGSRWCKACRAMKPVFNELAAEYGGEVTFMAVDVDQNLELAEYFNVKIIPDSCVIMGIENGKYVYMQKDGSTGTDRSKASVVGPHHKEVYEELLHLVLLKDEGNNSNEKEYSK